MVRIDECQSYLGLDWAGLGRTSAQSQQRHSDGGETDGEGVSYRRQAGPGWTGLDQGWTGLDWAGPAHRVSKGTVTVERLMGRAYRTVDRLDRAGPAWTRVGLG